MQKYSLQLPNQIIIGEGVLNQLPTILQDKNSEIIIIHGTSARESGLLSRIATLLKDKQLHFFSAPAGEPELENLTSILDKCRNIKNPEALLAVGGGSVIDGGKIIAALLTNSGNIADYHAGTKKLQQAKLFTVTIPTLSGSGAEVSPNSVIIDRKKSSKHSIRSQILIPEVALIDSDLTLNLPRSLTLYGGFDALTQAIEAFSGRQANYPTMGFALQAFRNLFSCLPGAAINDAKCRFALAEGAMLSGLALQSGLGAVHALAHPLGEKYNIPHGLACAVLLVEVLSCNLEKLPGYLDYLAGSVRVRNSEELIKLLRTLQINMQMPLNFSDYKISPADFPEIIQTARKSNNMSNNPASLSDEELTKILQKVC